MLRPTNPSPVPRFDGLPFEQWGSDEFHGMIEADVRLQREFWDYYRDRPAWFFKHCVKIVSKAKGLVPLDLSFSKYAKAQKYIAKRLFDQWFRRKFVRTVDAKARQVGRTTIQKALELWVGLYSEYAFGMTVADDDKGSQGILEMLAVMVETLPAWMRPRLKRGALNIVQFDGFDRRVEDEGRRHRSAAWTKDPLGRVNRSKFQIETAFNLRAGRKWTPSMLHATELAFWERNPALVLLGLRQGVPDYPGTVISLESTANGHGGIFYAEVLAAQKFGSTYELLFVPFYGVGEYAIGHDDPVGRLGEVFRDVDDLERMRDALVTGRLDRFPFDEEERALIELVKRDEDFGPEITAEQLAWRRWTIVNKCGDDLDTFHQEYPSTVAEAFIASGNSVFAASGLLWQRRHCQREPLARGELVAVADGNGGSRIEFEESAGGRVLLWARPDPKHEYIVAGDYAEGSYQYEGEQSAGRRGKVIKKDNTVFLAGDRNTREIVAECAGRIPPVEAAELGYKLALYFNRAWLVPENNAGYATQTIELARHFGYERVWMAKVYDQAGNDCGFKYGWNTNPATRPVMYSTARGVLYARSWKIPSKALLDELAGMVYRALPSGKNKEEAKPGEHDDRPSAFAILVRVDLELGEVAAPTVVDEFDLSLDHPNYEFWRARWEERKQRTADPGFVEDM